jgi:hypothetical protein
VARVVGFSKFDPHRPAPRGPALEARNPSAARRARLLKIGWLITLVYTAIGFAFLTVFWLWGNPF